MWAALPPSRRTTTLVLGNEGSLASVEALVDDIPAAVTHDHLNRPGQWNVFRATSNPDEVRRYESSHSAWGVG